jgi:hypothetical protein
MKNYLIRQLINVLAVFLTIIVNILANALPLNGLNTGEISDRFRVFFVPAGYVFSIWGLIYLGLAAYAVYQALPAQREDPRLRSIDGFFVLSCLANVAWIFLWHYEYFAWTLLAMLTLLLCLIAIYLRLDIGRGKVSGYERWLVHLPFSVYLGWITVATIANITSVLDYFKWSGWGISPIAWTVIMLAAALLIAGVVAWQRRDLAYLLVLVWAFTGIALKQADAPIVPAAAGISATVVVLFIILAGFKWKKSEHPAMSAVKKVV